MNILVSICTAIGLIVMLFLAFAPEGEASYRVYRARPTWRRGVESAFSKVAYAALVLVLIGFFGYILAVSN